MKVKKIIPYIIILFSFLVISSCNQEPAELILRQEQYDRLISNVEREKAEVDNNIDNSKENNQYGTGQVEQTNKTRKKIIIQTGDNLYKIAQRYNVSVSHIIEKNNLEKPYIIHPGKSLIIFVPSDNIARTDDTNSKSNNSSKSAIIYTVQPGDILGRIAKKYSVRISKIAQVNNLQEPYMIKPGMKLIIPAEHRIPQGDVFSSHVISSSNINKFTWPVKGKIIVKYGKQSDGLKNEGINIAAPIGSEVKPAKEGVVAYVGDEVKGYGNMVIIKHPGQWLTTYSHLNDVYVVRGQRVSAQDVIATVGRTGIVNSPQLHFSIRKKGVVYNPNLYLK